MISVVIPTFNAEATLGPTLAALVPAVVDGIVQEAILVDGGSTDETCSFAEAAGTRLIRTKLGRGTQLQAGAAAARGLRGAVLPHQPAGGDWAAEEWAPLWRTIVELGRQTALQATTVIRRARHCCGSRGCPTAAATHIRAMSR